VVPSKLYVGIDDDVHGGMTTIGKTIRDAWVFGLIKETETCEGWDLSRVNALLQRTNKEWDKYGCMVSQLPEDLSRRHREIHDAGVTRARAAGWTGEHELDDDD